MNEDNPNPRPSPPHVRGDRLFTAWVPADHGHRSGSAFRRLGLLTAVVLIVGIALWWYADHLGAMLQRARRITKSAATRESQPKPVAKPASATPLKAASTPAPAPVLTVPSKLATGEPNAADRYKNAFVLLEKLTPAEKALLTKKRGEYDPGEARLLWEKLQPIMDLLRQARAEACDWGLDLNGFDKPMPHLKLVTDLTKMAKWEAEYTFQSDFEGGLTDLTALSHLGRSVSDHMLIGFLVSAAVDNGITDVLRDHASRLPPALVPNARQLLSAGFPLEDLGHAMGREALTVAAMAERLADPQQSAEALAVMTHSMDASKLAGLSPEQQRSMLLTEVKWVHDVDLAFAGKAALPETEFQAWWEQVKAEAASRPLAAQLLPALETMREKMQTTTVRNALLMAGLNVLAGGPDQIGTVVDPWSGRPFTLVQTAKGFEVRSGFQVKGEPLAMEFTTKP
jgi:hypothetical protein